MKTLLIFAVISICSLVSFGQNTESGPKTIKKMNFRYCRVPEPIEILEVVSDGKVVKFDEPFTNHDWLKDLTIKFKNASGKTITYFTLNLLFPETAHFSEPAGIPTGQQFSYGLSPLAKNGAADRMKSLKADEIDEVSLTSRSYETMRQFVNRRRELNELSEVDLTLLAVYFDDGTHWSTCDLWYPDPNQPGKYVVVDDKP